jgi:hypothetical protein
VKSDELDDQEDEVLLQLVVALTLKLYIVLLLSPVAVAVVPVVLPEVTVVPPVVRTSQL